MAKETTKQNSKGETGKVLEPVNAPQPAVGEEKTAQKKNQKIEVAYQDKEGKEVNSLSDCRVLKIITKGGVDETLDILNLPKHVQLAAMVFGFNTAARNTHNTNEAGGKDGSAALRSRLAGWRNGEWASIGGGDGDEGIPLVIEAMIRAKKDAGAYTENMEEKWLTEYRSLDKTGKQEWTKTYSAKPSINVAILKIKAERAMAKAASAENNGAGASAEF